MELACRDLGMDCNYVAKGSSVAEVKQDAMTHAQVVHAAVLATMSSPEQMAAMDQLMDSKIH